MDLPLLYLDFDGVLHPNFASPSTYFCCLPLLEQALEGTPVQLVVSSSWRFHMDHGHIRRQFPLGLRERLTGFTGEAHIGPKARWHEINRHAAHHHVHDFRALDDAANEFPTVCPWLILCNGKTGLQQPQAQALRQWALKV